MVQVTIVSTSASILFELLEQLVYKAYQFTGFVWVLENLDSHGILFFSFPGLESHGNLCRVMESHGKLDHYKKSHELIFIVYRDRQKFH